MTSVVLENHWDTLESVTGVTMPDDPLAFDRFHPCRVSQTRQDCPTSPCNDLHTDP